MLKKIRRPIMINGVKTWISADTEQEYAEKLLKSKRHIVPRVDFVRLERDNVGGSQIVSVIPGDSQRISENLTKSQRKAWTKMDVRTMKHAAKLAEWSERVQACRSSGLPVRVWWERNNVCAKTYYRWERVYLAEVSKQLSIPAELPAPTGQLVRIDPDQLPEEVEVSAPASSVPATLNVKITLRYGGMSVEMPAGMDIGQIAVLMKALG